MTQVQISDTSSDRKYFTVTPQLVWALSRTPYDKVLWDVIKGVAGDDGECILSREDLAALAMMSTGQVSRCSKYLMSVGLLYGKFKRDPGYPQPVWHFRIPNLWKANVTWAEEHLSIASRVAWKKQQQVEPSRGDALKEPSPGDGGVIWSDTKKIQKNNQRHPSARATGAGAKTLGEFSEPKKIRKF